jgi:guanylate kinase
MTKDEFLKQLPKLVKNYRAADDVISHIKKLNLLMVVGPSGVGKTSVINGLGLKYIVGDTTRDSRPDEEDSKDYFFRKDYEQILDEIKNGRFVQVAIGSGGDFYATRSNSFPESGNCVMAVVADVIPIFRNLGFGNTISVFITPPSYKEWMQRLDSHDLSAEQLNKRLAEARRSLEFAVSDPNMHLVLNDDLQRAVQQTKGIEDGRVDSEREGKAKNIAESLLGRL